MKLLAYCRHGDLRGRIGEQVPEGMSLEWLARPDDAASRLQSSDVRGLVLLVSDWPDSEVAALIRLFAPRPVVLVDMTDSGHWHDAERPACVRLTGLDELKDLLHRLFSPQAYSPARTLALLSGRNDCDGAVVAIYAAWSLKKRGAGRVLILDLAMPQTDVAAYLDARPGAGLLDLVENRQRLSPGWLREQGLEATAGIDVVGLGSDSGLGQISAEALKATLERLETHYDHLLFNLTGVQPSPLLDLIAARCDQHWLLADQKHRSLAAAVDLAAHLFGQGIRPGGVNLLLAPCHRHVLPGRETVQAQIPLPLRGALPWCAQLLTHINAGTLLPPPQELAPLADAVDRALWLREPESWWRRLTQRTG
ncbi:hypothetical protein GCM10011348_44910 [Marinobacterium nitratireducens]|uniref:Flp pilus assembly protein, ATPase CpaE n=1 Tax=Marinobacterium nitratireducens TaxID=518897 RepID=A0A917ZQ69_9GAMM|nr:hypothetical protein [Marinobacterium nitratireducens]GGO88744.1 hypothetical protein GCM10011348_44910 [Marinobacterium nitratireducens]